MGNLIYFIIGIIVAIFVIKLFTKDEVDIGFFDYMLYVIIGVIAGFVWIITIMLFIVALGLGLLITRK